MSSITLVLLRLYIYSLPFTFALSLFDGRLTITLIISFLLLISLFLHSCVARLNSIPFLLSFALFSGFLICLLIGTIFTGAFSVKSINHLSAYTASIVFFGLVPLLAIKNVALRYNSIVLLKDFVVVARLSCLLVIFQFFLSNFLNIFLEEYIYFPTTIEARSTFLGLFYRSRGVAAEPGHFAFFLEFCVPFILYAQKYLVPKRNMKLWFNVDLTIILLALFSTGSPLGIATLILGFVISASLFSDPSKKTIALAFAFSAGVLAIILLLMSNSMDQRGVVDILSSVFLDKVDSTSSTVRENRLAVGLTLIGQADLFTFFLGYGPAVYDTQNLGQNSIIILYLLLLIEGGAIGFLFFVGGFLVLAVKAENMISSGKFFFFWALINCSIHYFFISNYYYPMIWFLFSLAVLLSIVPKDTKKHY